MTAEIVRYDNGPGPTPATTNSHTTPAAIDSWTDVIADVAKLAQHIADTDFVPQAMRGKPAAIAAAILAGREAGVGPMTALQHIHIIKGKPGQSAQLMRQLVLAAGHDIRYIETTDTRCVIEGRRRGEQEWSRVSFTADQAKKARIDLGGYPEDKLVARATTRLCRRKFADCIGGVPYTVEELEDGTDGDNVEVDEPADTKPAKPKRTAQRKTATRKATTSKTTNTAATPPAEPDGPPLPDEDDTTQSPDAPVTPAQLTKLHAIFTEHNITDRTERLRISSRVVNRQLDTSKDLTLTEAGALIDTLERCADTADFHHALDHLLDNTDTTDSTFAFPDDFDENTAADLVRIVTSDRRRTNPTALTDTEQTDLQLLTHLFTRDALTVGPGPSLVTPEGVNVTLDQIRTLNPTST